MDEIIPLCTNTEKGFVITTEKTVLVQMRMGILWGPLNLRPRLSESLFAASSALTLGPLQ